MEAAEEAVRCQWMLVVPVLMTLTHPSVALMVVAVAGQAAHSVLPVLSVHSAVD